MRSPRPAAAGALVTVLATATALATAGPALATTGGAGHAPTAGTAGPVPDLPAGVADAARRAEPALPKPAGWPFAESWSRTEGSGRLGGGASYWTDFVYDDHGAAAGPTAPAVAQAQAVSSLAPPDGTYTYPAGPADGNGADVFRAAVGADGGATYWRVDWNTLADPSVPIAEWTLDSDRDAATGTSDWPAGAGVHSPGIDHALVVSGRSARVVDTATGASTDVTAGLTVDRAARSFVVRVPRSVLPVTGTTRVRLAAGLADATGTAFAPVPPTQGGAPGGTSVYNVSFRSVAQEPPQYEHGTNAGQLGTSGASRATDLGNYWMEDHQAQALATGDVGDFRLDVDWAALARKTATPEPLVRGYSNRWYVTDLDLGQGVTTGGPSGGNDNRPNYLGRVQPYAVYVPGSYRPGTPAPLTWIEHSLSVNLNQYGALAPRQLQAECEDRGSICATTEGFGPDGWYFHEAEHDFWQVWRQLGLAYTLDPERTVMSGYSMGGYASYKLALTHPDLFARSMPLAGPPTCGLQVAGDVRTGTVTGGHCGADGDTGPLVANATWIPYVLGDGVADELVPYSSVLEQVQRFDAAGLRYHVETYPAEDHLVYATQDGFSSEVAALGGTPARVTDPGTVHYSWYPDLVDPRLGLGPTTVYWLSGLRARVSGPGALATVEAADGARPEPGHTVTRSTSPLVPGDPSPGVAVDSTWTPTGTTPPASCTLALRLTGVAALTVDTARALLPHGTATVAADGPASLTLSRLAPGTVVRSGTATAAAGRDGTATVPVTGGSTVTW